jgi:hypothetical protein
VRLADLVEYDGEPRIKMGREFLLGKQLVSIDRRIVQR